MKKPTLIYHDAYGNTYMVQNSLADTTDEFFEMASNLIDGFKNKQKLLIDQVNELKNANYDINLIYMKNQEMQLEDSRL